MVVAAALSIALVAACDDGTSQGSGTGGDSPATSQHSERPTRTGTRTTESTSRRPVEPTGATTRPTSCAAGLVC